MLLSTCDLEERAPSESMVTVVRCGRRVLVSRFGNVGSTAPGWAAVLEVSLDPVPSSSTFSHIISLYPPTPPPSSRNSFLALKGCGMGDEGLDEDNFLGVVPISKSFIWAFDSQKPGKRAAWVAQGFSAAFCPGPDPGEPGWSPTLGSLHGACFSLCLCLCLSLSLSL